MKCNGRFFLMSLCLLLISVTAAASDYKSWIPLLPDTVGSIGRSGKPDGTNMEINDQKWSTLHQTYSAKNGERSVELTIIGGKGAPPLAAFHMMSKMTMETEDQIIKTVKVKTYKALLNLEKKGERGTLMISLSDEMLVVLEGKPIKSEAKLLELAEQLPFAKFAAHAK